MRTYGVPVATTPTLEEKMRFLGAIVPLDPENAYFVRFFGPIDVVSPNEGDFDQFLKSIRLEPGGETPILWKVPEGWTVEPKRQLRVVTIKKDKAEIYISEPASGGELPNVNRWRTDFVGIPRIGMGEYLATSTDVQLGRITAKRVDFRGPGSSKKAMMPPFMGQP
jgi:hypothetical protein